MERLLEYSIKNYRYVTVCFPRKSSIIFGKSDTIVLPSENSWRILGNLRKAFGNLRKTVKKVVVDILYNKQNNKWLLIGMKFLIALCLLVRYQVQNSKTNSIPTGTHVLPSIYTSCLTILLIIYVARIFPLCLLLFSLISL